MQYYDQLLPRGFVKPEDQEPNIEGLEFYLDAFRELGSCRPGGMDLMAIPFTAIVEYSRIYQIGDFDDFAFTIRCMDNVYLDMNAKSQEKGKNAGVNSNAKNNNSR